MSRVILPHTLSAGDVINPEYVNENFEVLAEAANSLGASNIQTRSIPQSALESPMALGTLVVPIGYQYANIDIANGGDGNEDMLAIRPVGGNVWHYAGKFPVDITIVNVGWCFAEYSGSIYGHVVLANDTGLGLAQMAFDTFIPSPSVPAHEWEESSPRWIDSRDCNIGWPQDQALWAGVHSLTVVDAAADNYLYENTSIIITYKYRLFA